MTVGVEVGEAWHEGILARYDTGLKFMVDRWVNRCIMCSRKGENRC